MRKNSKTKVRTTNLFRTSKIIDWTKLSTWANKRLTITNDE